MEEMIKQFIREIYGDEELPVKLENVCALAVLQELDKCKREIERNHNKPVQ